MFMRFGRGLVAATALSFLTVGGLQATAAMAAVPAGFDEGAGVVSVEVVPVSATSDGSGRPVVEQPPAKPIWCTDVETGEIFQCGWYYA